MAKTSTTASVASEPEGSAYIRGRLACQPCTMSTHGSPSAVTGREDKEGTTGVYPVSVQKNACVRIDSHMGIFG